MYVSYKQSDVLLHGDVKRHAMLIVLDLVRVGDESGYGVAGEGALIGHELREVSTF